jgi:antitoxin (DNA-binding transcriptional repressor) of toxin-antitoxin stability system
MKVTVHTAKTNLCKPIEAALAGEEVIIARGDKPVVRLVPIERSSFRLGGLEGQLGESPDFFEPMEEEDLRPWEGGGEANLEDGKA